MQITITDDGIKVTEALRQYILDKFKRLERITTESAALHITLSLEHVEQVAKGLLHTHGAEFYASAKAESLYPALDELVDKMEQQVNKHKEREKEKRRSHPKGWIADDQQTLDENET
ncbi:ribosome hibernation-promoting factor, HPF/YfiA family [Rickettsiella massiliensis]|uniref:ribosome hibernation-promoting factor, HPF/YfiA family n=1 Tax=Rickettsiella massiliensis TaxID=676517 RepID=UPI00029AEF9B|nr:ribosome-associated translation inhibitor RaiA [Rickettsiella massiliensis]